MSLQIVPLKLRVSLWGVILIYSISPSPAPDSHPLFLISFLHPPVLQSNASSLPALGRGRTFPLVRFPGLWSSGDACLLPPGCPFLLSQPCCSSETPPLYEPSFAAGDWFPHLHTSFLSVFHPSAHSELWPQGIVTSVATGPSQKDTNLRA